MRSAQQALSRAGQVGTELPMPWTTLAALRAIPRAGQISLVASAPNAGKTAFAIAYAVQTELPTLYFSADTDPYTMATRIAASASGREVDAIEKQATPAEIAEILRQVEHIRLCTESSLSVPLIHDECRAWYEIYGFGAGPDLIIVDNLVNVTGKGDSGWQVKRWVVDELKSLARETQAHVMVLAHAVGSHDGGGRPIPLDGLEDKLGKSPDMVLTLDREGPWGLNVRPVKNKSAVADPSGGLAVKLLADMRRMDIRDWPPGPWRLQ